MCCGLELKAVLMVGHWMVCTLLECITELIILERVVLFGGLKCLLYKYVNLYTDNKTIYININKLLITKSKIKSINI